MSSVIAYLVPEDDKFYLSVVDVNSSDPEGKYKFHRFEIDGVAISRLLYEASPIVHAQLVRMSLKKESVG